MRILLFYLLFSLSSYKRKHIFTWKKERRAWSQNKLLSSQGKQFVGLTLKRMCDTIQWKCYHKTEVILHWFLGTPEPANVWWFLWGLPSEAKVFSLLNWGIYYQMSQGTKIYLSTLKWHSSKHQAIFYLIIHFKTFL